jgi:hypothetical protein
MGLFSSLSEGMVSSILCGYLRKYSGPNCTNLRTAIDQNVDLYKLWAENARAEGVRGPREVRQWTRMFPRVQYMMTAPNVKRWLREQGMENIARTVETTKGGDECLEWQVGRFRTELWGGA